MTISYVYVYVGVLEHNDMQKNWFPKDGVRGVIDYLGEACPGTFFMKFL